MLRATVSVFPGFDTAFLNLKEGLDVGLFPLRVRETTTTPALPSLSRPQEPPQQLRRSWHLGPLAATNPLPAAAELASAVVAAAAAAAAAVAAAEAAEAAEATAGAAALAATLTCVLVSQPVLTTST